jgi:hypothetical protein
VWFLIFYTQTTLKRYALDNIGYLNDRPPESTPTILEVLCVFLLNISKRFLPEY